MDEKSRYEQMKAETARLKELDLIEVAEGMGYTFRKRGRTYECNEEKGLVYFPNTNTFFHFYDNSGGSVIDFVMKYSEVSFQEAIRSLTFFAEGRGYIPARTYTEGNAAFKHEMPTANISNKGDIKLPPANDNFKRAFAYLVKSREISPDIVSRLMHDKKIYEEKGHHNVVFIGYDSSGIPKHAFIRGTITDKQFRGDVKGSDKNYGFNVTGTSNTLVVFEAPIDLLSYMTIFPDTNSHLLALGMLATSPVDTYIKEHPDIKNISFVLDADAPGKEAAAKFEKEFTDKGFNIIKSNLSEKLENSSCKDVNEYLIYLKQKQAERQEQPEQAAPKQQAPEVLQPEQERTPEIPIHRQKLNHRR